MADNKICSACKLPKPLAEFSTDKSKPDGLTSRCRACIAESRSADSRAEKKAIALHKKHLEACRRTLENPASSDLARRNAERDIRLADKHLEKILKPFNDKRAEVAARERAIRDAVANAAQAEADAIADAEYYAAKAEEEKQAAIVKAAADADTLAATKEVAAVYEWIRPMLMTEHLDLKARARLKAHCEAQATACSQLVKTAVGRDEVIAKALAQAFASLAQKLEILTEEILRKKPDRYFMEGGTHETNRVFRTSQECSLLRHFADLAWRRNGVGNPRLFDAPPVILTPEPPPQTLENLRGQELSGHQTLEWREREEKKRMAKLEALRTGSKKDREFYEALSKDESLGIEGGGLLADERRRVLREYKENYPREAAQRALDALKPRDVSVRTTVFKVPCWTHDNPKARDLLYWPNGALVKQGEILFDFRLKCWVRQPAPASVDIDFEDPKRRGPSDEQIARMSPESQQFYIDQRAEDAEWTQGADGHFRTTNGKSPWGKPERIQFLAGARHVEGIGKDHFSMGYWWSESEAKGTDGDLNKIPQPILAPLPKLQMADSIARERPPSPEEEARMNEPPLTPWQRHEMKMQQQKERDAELLRN